MFFLFSNKLGCLGSLLLSGIFTLIVLSILGLINLGGGKRLVSIFLVRHTPNIPQ